jgi:hypothetical protein
MMICNANKRCGEEQGKPVKVRHVVLTDRGSLNRSMVDALLPEL